MGTQQNATLSGIGFLFFLFPVVSYFFIFRAQHKQLEDATYRLQVLVTRCALFLPYYAFFIVLSLWAPEAYEFFIVPITIMEGYSFYCFFSLLVSNIGGPSSIVALMEGSNKGYFCCGGCCPSSKVAFYRRTTWGVWHLVFTRSVLAILAAIGHYSYTEAGKALYAILNVTNAVILFYGIIHMVLLYEYVYDECVNISGVPKLLLLKISVGLIVVQGLIEQFLVMAKDSPYNDDSQFSTADKTQRGYCALVLMEFILLSALSYFAFATKINPSMNNKKGAETAPESGLNSAVTQGAFFCSVMRFHDVFGTLTYNDGEGVDAPIMQQA